jgi:Transcriptional regulators containing a DNA-binding HTH domain and an aminotransferase domain (MocR family) and their eukaryotic orthologs
MTLNLDNNRSKVQQLADGITAAISSGEFKANDTLPSINKLSAEYKLSRDTAYKAYQKLKNRGIIGSTPTKGYYVANTINNIFVLLDVFSAYKDDFYRELISNLPFNYRIDLYFHQYNEKLFNSLILDSLGRYDLYLVSNLTNDLYCDILDRLDNSKVLLVDFGKFNKEKFSYVCQGFDQTLYDCLTSGVKRIKAYNELVFIYPENSEHPKSCISYFEKFCTDNNIESKMLRSKFSKQNIEAGKAYIVVRHSDVIEFVKICREKNLKLGKDVGLITFNDTPMLEIIENGISVVSTDFKQMGKLSAEYVKTREKIQTYVPTKLIIRGSL